jgi:hypothetical protein
MRQPGHARYQVKDVSVTFDGQGEEMKTVIVGGVAAGGPTGAQLRRLDESAEIVADAFHLPLWPYRSRAYRR